MSPKAWSKVEEAVNGLGSDFPTPDGKILEGCVLCDLSSACRLIGAATSARSEWIWSCAYRQIIDRVGWFTIDNEGRPSCAYGE